MKSRTRLRSDFFKTNFMLRLMLIVSLMMLNSSLVQSQTEKVIIVTLDGMRWQEIFRGVDTNLMSGKKYVADSQQISNQFWDNRIEERRKKLFPFLWNVVAQQGQLLGNRDYKNYVNCSNPYKFSYPGYNEIFTGYPDTLVNSNDKRWNQNENVLEFLHQFKEHKGKIAAFTTWDVFPYILNNKRNGMYVNADKDSFNFQTPELKLLNEMQFIATRPIGVRPDVFTYFAAREYLKQFKPDVLYIAFDETDDFAHSGKYDQYLLAAHAEDKMLEDLWNIVQNIPEYRNKTTLIVTTDHGRGNYDINNWKHHGERIKEADEIWIAAIGASVSAKGELKMSAQYFQKQIASTIAAMMGKNFTANHPVAPRLIFE